ncbi:leucine--tRNA ligase [Sulfurisphaera ohwakuensis]|uniref:leucine--tRNA ligase n=1 Tax=Sulfurisphaera ohwakuensis TaxID=69656 RepID=UPI0036F31C1D
MSLANFFNEIAFKWQKEWENNKVYEANPETDRPKKFITVAFPYTNSPLHIGHGRTYITADIYARYLRMKGYNVLFPFAFQFTGTPILSIAESVKRGDEEIISTFVNIYQIPKEEIEKFSDPTYLAEYFKNDMKSTAKKLGLSVDWRREFTTVDPAFEKFVQWQYRKLMELGYIKREDSPVAYCPRDEFPVGMHDTKGDVEPEITDLDGIYFPSVDYFFIAATPRPETIFGAVALLVNPEADYVIATDSLNRKVIISRQAYDKLKYQISFREEGEKKGKNLVGMIAKNPVTEKEIKVLPSKFVDPSIGTGVVMAVPSHEPLHYIALTELKEEFELIPVIKTDELGELPGVEAVGLAQTRNPAELKDYIDTIYRIEYHKGIMREDLVDLVPNFMKEFVKDKIAGKLVKDAREKTRELLDMLNSRITIYEISNGPVYCRCGAEIVVKVIKGQWFIDYSNPIWKTSVLKSLDKINFIPADSKKEMEKIIFNLQPRAFTRSRGLGVRLPWDEKEIIDSLSDSTIYTAFYTIVHRLKYPISLLNDKFWDYILLDRGTADEVSKELGIPKEQLEEIKSEFKYWYPVDSRHSGRDLIQNHLPYYLFHHFAIFSEKFLPRQIVTNGFIRVGGKKMSKSFGNIYPLNRAIDEYGVETVRIALTSTSSISDDIEFNSNIAKSIAEQLKKIHDLISKLLEIEGVNERRDPDVWLLSIFKRYIEDVDKAYENLDLRTVYMTVYYTIYETIKDYIELTNAKINKDIIKKVISIWLRLMAPITPHLAEELWHKMSNTFVVKEKFPSINEVEYNEKSLLKVEYLRSIIEDVNRLSSELGKEAEKVVIYVNDDNNLKELLKKAIIAIKDRKSLRDFMIENNVDDKTARRIYELANVLPSTIRDLIVTTDIDEEEVIVQNINFLMNKLDLREMIVYSSTDEKAPNILGKKDLALPYKPGIAIL